MKIGLVKNWNGERGFGFLRADDVFCHASALPLGTRALEVGSTLASRLA